MTPADISLLCGIANRLLDFPQLQGLDIENEIWVKQQSTVLKSIRAGKELACIRAQWADQLKPGAWSVDTVPLRSDIQALGAKWWRFLSPKWKSTVQQVKALLVVPASRSVSEYLGITNAIQEAFIADRILSEHEPILVQAYGRHWRGSASNWEALKSQFETIVAVSGEIDRGSLPNP